MTLPDWVNDLSLVCGVGGLVLSYFAYRRSGQMKAIDLRLELRKIDANLHGLLKRLPAHIARARSSREALLAKLGPDGSAVTKPAPLDSDLDMQELERIAASLPPPRFDYRGLKPVQLSMQLVERHETLSQLRIIEEKYESSIAEDERCREAIRARLPNWSGDR